MKLDYRQWTFAAAAVVSSIVLVVGLVQGNVVPALIFIAIQGAVLIVLLWATRPGLGDAHISHEAARAAASDDDVIVYWRPG